jgi:Peptidase propeptide and YPEB domain
MQTILALAMIAVFGGIGAALANDQGRNDDRAAQARAISADDMKAKSDNLGYDVEHMKKDDEYYHADLIDRARAASAPQARQQAA